MAIFGSTTLLSSVVLLILILPDLSETSSSRSSILKSLLHQVFERHGITPATNFSSYPNKSYNLGGSSSTSSIHPRTFLPIPNTSRLKSLSETNRRVSKRSCFARSGAESVSSEKDRAAVVLTGRVEGVLYSSGSESDTDGSTIHHRTRRNHYHDRNKNANGSDFSSQNNPPEHTIITKTTTNRFGGSGRLPFALTNLPKIKKADESLVNGKVIVSGKDPIKTPRRESSAAARIRVKRVIKGDRSLENTLIVVVVHIEDDVGISGVDDDSGSRRSSSGESLSSSSEEAYGYVTDRRLCMGRLRIKDTRIFMLGIDSYGRLILLSNPLPLTLKNLREINGNSGRGSLKDQVVAAPAPAVAPPAYLPPHHSQEVERISLSNANQPVVKMVPFLTPVAGSPGKSCT
jgi:hypothetical protein